MDDIEKILAEKPEGKKESEQGRWKGGRYDTSKPEEAQAWAILKKILKYSGDNNNEVKMRIDNLAKAIDSGVLEIRKSSGKK
jgi:hypothetical protein